MKTTLLLWLCIAILPFIAYTISYFDGGEDEGPEWLKQNHRWCRITTKSLLLATIILSVVNPSLLLPQRMSAHPFSYVIMLAFGLAWICFIWAINDTIWRFLKWLIK